MEAIPRKLKKGKEHIDGFVPKMTAEEQVQAMEEDMGFCIRCGETQDGCEPDARNYECESCGERGVYGICSLVESGLVEIAEDKATDPLYANVESSMRAEMHRGFVSMQMFCACGAVLDCHKSVALDFYRVTDKQLVNSCIICLTCWDGSVGEVMRNVGDGSAYTLEVYNGKTGDTTTIPEERNNSDEQTSLNL